MRTTVVAVVLVIGAGSAFGQTSFEVASLKASTTEMRGRQLITPSPAGVTMYNMRMKDLLVWAYHLQGIQISGPGWLENDRYDVVAKAAGPVPLDQVRVMLQQLLAERFKLTTHRENKELPAYVMTIAKGGHKLKESPGEGNMEMKSNGRMGASFTHATLAQLSEMVSGQLQGLVVDQTGLKGSYDFTLDMASFMADMSKPMGLEDMMGLIMQAVNEQLGIKIDQRKVPAEVLVVDHAERAPVQN